jgi:hypothetical protein
MRSSNDSRSCQTLWQNERCTVIERIEWRTATDEYPFHTLIVTTGEPVTDPEILYRGGTMCIEAKEDLNGKTAEIKITYVARDAAPTS